VGGERFRLLDIVVGDEPPYLQGRVEWLADEERAEEVRDAGDAAAEPTEARDAEGTTSVAGASLAVLVGSVRNLFLEYVSEVAGLGLGREDVEAATRLDAVADDPVALSWLVASAALLTAEDRQGLLAQSDTRRRLMTESRLLRRELTMLQEIGAVPVPLQQFAVPMTVN
jgi:hypothetical protein